MENIRTGSADIIGQGVPSAAEVVAPEAVGPKAEVVAEEAGSLVFGTAELASKDAVKDVVAAEEVQEAEDQAVVKQELPEEEKPQGEVSGSGVESVPSFESQEDQLRAVKTGDNFKVAIFSDPQIRGLVGQMFKGDPDFLKRLSQKGMEITPAGFRVLKDYENKMRSGVVPKPGSPVWGSTGARSQIGDLARSSAKELKTVIERAFR